MAREICGKKGTLGRRLWSPKPVPKTHPKTGLWLAGTVLGETQFFLREKRADGGNALCGVLLSSPQRVSRSFCRSETALTNAQVHQAAVRTAQPSGFAKQTEKGAWKPSVSLLTDRIPNPFSINCRDLYAANHHARRVFCFSFDAKEKRPPPPSPYSCLIQLRRRRIFFSPSNQFHSARIFWFSSRLGPVSATSMPASRASLSISQMSSALAPELR